MATASFMKTAKGSYRGTDVVASLQSLVDPFDIEVKGLAGYRTRRSSRSRGCAPVGHVTHWTAGSDTRPVCRQLCIKRALVTFYVPPKGGVIEVVSDGRTGHPGKIDSDVLGELKRGEEPEFRRHAKRNDSNSGYTYLTGVEIEASGKRTPPRKTMDTAFALGAAMCVMFDWPATSHVDHAMVAGPRKVDFTYRTNGKVTPYVPAGTRYNDPNFVNFGKLTAEWMDRMDGAKVITLPQADEVENFSLVDPSTMDTLKFMRPARQSSDVAYLQTLLTLAGFRPGLIDGWYGEATLAALNAWQASKGYTETHIVSQWSWRPLIAQVAELQQRAA